jgi:hypothetical protein
MGKEEGGWWVGLGCDIVAGYMFWCSALMFIDAVFFFPLFDMGLSGFEFPMIGILFFGGGVMSVAPSFIRYHSLERI